MDNDNALKSIKHNLNKPKKTPASPAPDFLFEEKTEEKIEDAAEAKAGAKIEEEIEKKAEKTPEIEPEKPESEPITIQVSSEEELVEETPEPSHEEILETVDVSEPTPVSPSSEAKILTMHDGSEPETTPAFPETSGFDPESPRPSTEPKKKHKGLLAFLVIILVIILGACAASYYVIVYRPDLNPLLKFNFKKANSSEESSKTEADEQAKAISNSTNYSKALFSGLSWKFAENESNNYFYAFQINSPEYLQKLLNNSLSDTEKTSLALSSNLVSSSVLKDVSADCSRESTPANPCPTISISYADASNLTEELFNISSPQKSELPFLGGKYSFFTYNSQSNAYEGMPVNPQALMPGIVGQVKEANIKDNKIYVDLALAQAASGAEVNTYSFCKNLNLNASCQASESTSLEIQTTDPDEIQKKVLDSIPLILSGKDFTNYRFIFEEKDNKFFFSSAEKL